MRPMLPYPCPHYDCPNRTVFGYCNTRGYYKPEGCVDEHFQENQLWSHPINKSENAVIKRQTNADKYFRNATDEELAEYLSERSVAPSCTCRCHKDHAVYGELRTFCRDCWIDWLKQEVEE